MSDTEFHDHSDEVLDLAQVAKKKALLAIGLVAEGYAKDAITAAKAVDTGRLRNSITFVVKSKNGQPHPYQDDNGKAFEGGLKVGAEDDEVIIGTNVEYAAGIELGTHRKAGAVHFLKSAATDHSDEYKKIVKEAFEST